MCAYGPDIDRCDCNSIHEDVVASVRQDMPDENRFINLAEASEYVYKNNGNNVFIFELVELLQKEDTTLNKVITFFKKWDNNCLVKKMNNNEFDILILFIDREDPYYYCFKDEGCHVVYHRFLPEDYADFGFEM